MRTARAAMLWVLGAAAALSGCAAFHGTSRDDVVLGEDVGTRRPAVSLFERPWVWRDEQGQPMTFARWKGEPVLVTAIYTECHATCPRTVDKLRRLYAALGGEHGAPAFVLVTLDPKNDTPERLRRFKEAQKLPEAWHLVAGSPEDTEELTDLLDIHVLNSDAHIVHDARIVIFDGRGMAARTYSGFSLDEET
ncbi:MAG TPA: SCO family protein [Polyangiaceae bacterium]|jgi:protein SCO1/2